MQAQFTPQAVVPNFPAEMHEALVVTDELVQWAAQYLPAVRVRYDQARAAERGTLLLSTGEASWNAAGGPEKAIEADSLANVVNLLELLAAGKNYSGITGWIDRMAWARILEATKWP